MEEKKYMNITPVTVFELEKMLNWLTEHGTYLAQIGNLRLYYKGTEEDTIDGKREVFLIKRKIR